MASGKTYGKIISIGVTEIIKDELGSTKFKSQILASIYNIPGDSGSILLNDKNEAVGLLHSGSGKDGTEHAICSDIKKILRDLNIYIFNG